MKQFIDRHFVERDDVRLGEEHAGVIPMAGTIWCAGGIHIEVYKELRILSRMPGDVLVQTHYYRYHVQLAGEGSVVRFDHMHKHRPYRHVHKYPLWTGVEKEEIEEIWKEEDIPTLGDVLFLVEDWHHRRIGA